MKEGPIKGDDIDKKELIDQHYYSIASKATILKPADLNVPDEMSHDSSGCHGRMLWTPARSSTRSAEQLDAAWAQAKADKNLVKFGGGFYCGMIVAEDKSPIYVLNGSSWLCGRSSPRRVPPHRQPKG